MKEVLFHSSRCNFIQPQFHYKTYHGLWACVWAATGNLWVDRFRFTSWRDPSRDTFNFFRYIQKDIPSTIKSNDRHTMKFMRL